MENDKNKKLHPKENKTQTQLPTKKQAGGKHQPAVKTAATDSTAKTANQANGLNQSDTNRDDLFPSD